MSVVNHAIPRAVSELFVCPANYIDARHLKITP